MGHFLQSEKPKQAAFKQTSGYFSETAIADGDFLGHKYPFCLPQECVEENLVPEIRHSAPAFFQKHEIKWHSGRDHRPSAHMCDSQVCCVNFLFPLADKPDALKEIMRRVFPEIHEMLPVEDDRYISFEWVGKGNYLHESRFPNRKPSRGALFTSADAVVQFMRKDGKEQTVLIEWKYTESYYPTSLKFARKSNTDRTSIYRFLYSADDFPLNKVLVPDFDILFFEPFYQLMRQQCLANEMEKVHEDDAEIVSVLHISPAHNLDFKRVTSPEMINMGDSPTGVWKGLIKNQDRFTSVSTEELFGDLPTEKYPEIKAWAEYIHKRYNWVSSL